MRFLDDQTKNHRVQRGGLLVAAVCGFAFCSGCSSLFNQSFINLVAQPVPDTSGRVPTLTIDNAPGHVVVIFINNTRFDPRLIDYFDGIGVDTSDPNLRPRVRLRVDIRYTNNNTTTFEFIDGSDIFENSVITEEGPMQVVTVPPRDLVENDLTNVVAVCDVSVVQPGGGIESAQTSTEVFVPAALRTSTSMIVNNVVVFDRTVIPPRFVALQPDDVDENLNITLQRNFDIRDVPVAANDLLCGTVVAFTLSGTLQLPFVVDNIEGVVPGYDLGDTISPASIPGRYDFLTTVR